MKANKICIVTLMIISAIFSLPFYSLAQAGSLDLSFGNNGIVITDIGPPYTNDAGAAVTIQPDGKILMAGNSTTGVSLSTGMIYIGRFALTRYNANGSLDNSFGVGGKVTTFLGNYTLYLNQLNAMALQSDGKILVAGSGMNESVSVLIRYKHDGTLDSTFDSDGIVTTAISTVSSIQSICIQPDGKIVTAGSSLSSVGKIITVARYKSNGTLDSTFNYDGIVTTSIGNINDVANSIALQTDGKILVCGQSLNGANFDFALVRYNTNGSLDTTFDVDGKITTTIGTNSFAYSISLQPDGKILAAGKRENGTTTCLAIARYNINGSLDSTFGTTGIVTTSIGNWYDEGRALAIQIDGAILLAGRSTLNNGSSYNSALVRYKTNGTLDSTFDNDGIVMTSFGPSSYSHGNSVALQMDGKIIVAGMYMNFSHHDFALARYYNDSTYCPPVNYTQSITICSGQSISVGSNNYTLSGIYIDTLVAINTCDSIVTTNLIVSPIPILTTTINGIQISSNQNLATYQWIDCDNGNLPIVGETNQSFTPIMNGNYAVIVSLGSCTDTSECIHITSVGVSDQQLDSIGQISIYPNPFSSWTILQSDNLLRNATLNVYNVYGQQVKQIKQLFGNIVTLYRDDLQSGLYFIQIIQDNKIVWRRKLLIND